MKRLIAPILIGAVFGSFAMAKDMDMKAEIEALKAQMSELKAAQKKINIKSLKKQLLEVKAHDAHDNIKFTADLRTAYDVIDYRLSNADGTKSTVSNGIWTNKFTLEMAAQPRDDLVFHGALGIYKSFGYNGVQPYNSFQNMDWYADETPSGDAIFRLKEAYFIYFGNAGKVPYTVSLGRRPAVNGFLTNYRDYQDKPASPIGHNINMEFDGASIMAKLENVTGISGMYFKICLGRGNSNTDTKYPTFDNYMGSMTLANATTTPTPYSKTDLNSANMDLAGLIMRLYDDGQYTVMFNYFKGWNMMGANFTNLTNSGNPANDKYNIALKDVGDLTGGALSFQTSGIGDGINDFLDDTNFFVSFAWSKTDPKGKTSTLANAMGMDPTVTANMLGSSKSETGTSYYVGVNFPCMLVDGARWGLEYNHGSKYWRSFDYGEDTLIGSKLSTRGDAYEVFYDLPMLGKYLTAQVRYTYINYNYAGSDMFFGPTGAPLTESEAHAYGMAFIDHASDLRLFVRYRY